MLKVHWLNLFAKFSVTERSAVVTNANKFTNSTKYQIWPKFFTADGDERYRREICHTSYSHFHDFPELRTHSRILQAWKMWNYNPGRSRICQNPVTLTELTGNLQKWTIHRYHFKQHGLIIAMLLYSTEMFTLRILLVSRWTYSYRSMTSSLAISWTARWTHTLLNVGWSGFSSGSCIHHTHTHTH